MLNSNYDNFINNIFYYKSYWNPSERRHWLPPWSARKRRKEEVPNHFSSQDFILDYIVLCLRSFKFKLKPSLWTFSTVPLMSVFSRFIHVKSHLKYTPNKLKMYLKWSLKVYLTSSVLNMFKEWQTNINTVEVSNVSSASKFSCDLD